MALSGDFLKKIADIVDKESIVQEKSIIEKYFSDWVDWEIDTPILPSLKVSVEKIEQIKQIIDLAISYNVNIIPTSSRDIFPRYLDKSTYAPNSILLDLSKMNRIRNIDRKNRVVLIEPGVSYSDLIPALKSEGLRISAPLLPQDGKSVISACLEKEPSLIPRYHWITLDPLICLELVFGNGHLFRTGSAAGPGNLEEQFASGQAQLNPMGPAQLNFAGVIQGAMGTFGIVTWASIKCELLPTSSKLLAIEGNNLESLLELMQFCVKNRFGDEIFLMNRTSFKSFLMSIDLPGGFDLDNINCENILIINLSGAGEFSEDKIKYQEEIILEELRDNNRNSSLSIIKQIDPIKQSVSAGLYSTLPSNSLPWNHSFKQSCREIFFLTPFSEIINHYTLMKELHQKESSMISDIGIYIQPLVQGCNYHLQFDLYFNDDFYKEKKKVSELFQNFSKALMDKGAFFARPYGVWRDIFENIEKETKIVLGKVKKIFDPHNILNQNIIPY